MKYNKIISYSLYGTKKLFFVGAIRNAEAASLIYPGWQPVFYCGPSIEMSLKKDLLKLNSIIFEINESENYASSLWRFRAIFLPGASHIIFRDSDSRLTQREAIATNEWIKSEKTVHIMKDHPNHESEIMAGMCGLYAPDLKLNKNKLLKYRFLNYYGVDQDFLRREIYKKNYSKLIHDSINLNEEKSKNFIPRAHSMEFVGEVFDENEMPNLNDREKLKDFKNNKKINFKRKKTSE